MEEKLKNISNLNILVVGDIMLDHYVEGSITKMSAEAPISILNQSKEYNVLGGAANVASNVASLGANTFLLGIIGNDEHGKMINSKLSKSLKDRFKIIQAKRKSTVKNRFIVDGKQVFRYDKEDTFDIAQDVEIEVIESFKKLITTQKVDGVIFQDYNKGLFTKSVIDSLLKMCNENLTPTFVDPKFKNYWSYKNTTVFKPNRKELFDAMENDKTHNLEEVMAITHKRLNCDILICTLSSEGVISYFDKRFIHKRADTFDVLDVSGAGDTTVAMIAIAYLLGFDIDQILKLSNGAGKSACLSHGVSTVSITDILSNI